MSEILLSHSYFYRLDPKQWKNKTPFPPLGTLYAASLLRKNGFAVDFVDSGLASGPEEILPKIAAHRPKYFVVYDDGFNYLTKMCLTIMREACLQMVQKAKECDSIVIVCSSDSTDHFEKYLEAGADYVIRGEGEQTLVELIIELQTGNTGEQVKGIAVKIDGQARLNPAREVLRNLDVLPMPAWDLVNIESYRNIWKQSGRPFTLNIATTRGCPYKCNWCAKPIYGNRYNSHSPEYIAKQVEFLQEHYGVKRFWMCDDIFGLKPDWVRQFAKELSDRKIRISYYIQSRVDLLLKENTIDLLAASGLEEVWVGAESASQKILDAMDKGTTVAQIYEATKLLKAKNIQVAFFLQFGYPGEKAEDISRTIQMVRDLMPDNIGISVSYPLPGTVFYDRVREQLTTKQNWADSDDLEMMFKGTYRTDYYRNLQRYVHKEFRKLQGLQHLRQILKNPAVLSVNMLKSVGKLGYYIPSCFLDKVNLKKLQHEN